MTIDKLILFLYFGPESNVTKSIDETIGRVVDKETPDKRVVKHLSSETHIGNEILIEKRHGF